MGGTGIVVGLTVLAPLAPVGAARQGADILAPQRSQDGPGPLGALATDGGGDLAVATPTQALRVRVNRMLAAPADSYAHLRDWACGARRGELGRPTEMARAQIGATRMLRADPDILDARVTIIPNPAGVRRAFLYRVEVQDRFGGQDDWLTGGEGD